MNPVKGPVWEQIGGNLKYPASNGMKIKKSGLVLAIFVAFFIFSVSVAAQAVVRSFNTKGSFGPGWVVALSKDSDSTVELSPADQPSRIYGLVIDPSAAPFTVQKQNQQVFVATSGNYPVLVSTQNGSINSGDYLTISNTDGIAAKANEGDEFIIGRALGGFSSNGSAIVYASDGSALGRIMIQLAPGKNPQLKQAANIPGPLRNIGESLAGKTVSAVRVYAALAVFTITALIAAVLLFGGIRNAMVAIGRNPLSRHSVMRGLVQVIVAAVAVLIIGILGVYLLLKI